MKALHQDSQNWWTVHFHWKNVFVCFPHKIDGEGHFLALLQKDGERTPNALESAGKPSKLPQELTDFLKDVSMPVDTTRIQIKDTKVFLMPEGLSGCKGLRFLRSGLYMGELLKKRFEPSQAFAMVLKKEEYASVIDLPATDERIIRYLKERPSRLRMERVPKMQAGSWYVWMGIRWAGES